MNNIYCDDLILGGGWSGLWAAKFLTKKGRKVVVVEKDHELGGLARTLSLNGFKFDIGGHRIFFRDNLNFEQVKPYTDKNDLITLKKVCKIYFNRNYIEYPPTLFSLPQIGPFLLAKILFELNFTKYSCKIQNFEDWVIKNYGRSFYKIFFKSYTEKVWGTDCKDLSYEWAKLRIGQPRIKSFLFRKLPKQKCCTDDPLFFFYPANGMGTIIKNLEMSINKHNLIFKNSKINKLFCKNDNLNSADIVVSGIKKHINFKNIYSSIPLPELALIAPDNVSKDLLHASSNLRYRSLIIAGMVINRQKLTKWHWSYFSSPDIIFSRLHEPKFWSRNMAKDSKKSLVCAEIFCNTNDHNWNSTDQELSEQIYDCLKSTGIMKGNEKTDEFSINRIKYAYPLLLTGFDKHLASINRSLAIFKNLKFIGRSGTHQYYDLEECLVDVKEKTLINQ